MFNREDFSHIPTEYEMKEYINNDLWEDFCKYMKNKYNINPKKASKSLCTIYPRENYFTMLVVIGKNEKENFEEMLSLFCYEIQQIYNNTEEGNNQRWLMIDLEDKDKRYEDVKKIIEIRSK